LEINTKCVLEKGRPYIIASNHQSLFDITFLFLTFREHFPRFVAKTELSRWIPGVSYNLRIGGNAIVDRSHPKQAISAILKLSKRMEQEKFYTVIFPEGTRARDGVLKRFKSSGIGALLKYSPSAHILPVAINGSWRYQAKHFRPFPRNIRVNLTVCEAVEPTKYGDIEEVVFEVEKRVREALR